MSGTGGPIVFDAPGDVWVFAYGSLMWDPGFAHEEIRPALLRGYHRAFCVHSEVYRGTPERPGLSLGLDRGGACRGLAFRVAASNRAAAAAYLEARELVEDIYFCRRVPLTGADGARFDAYTFIVNRHHAIYAPKQPLDVAARIIAGARGDAGTNREYLDNTVAHLDALGIADGPLHELARRVARIAG